MNCLVMNYFSLIFRKYSSCEEAFPVKSVDINQIFIFLPEFQVVRRYIREAELNLPVNVACKCTSTNFNLHLF